jgi:hypothetical protein
MSREIKYYAMYYDLNAREIRNTNVIQEDILKRLQDMVKKGKIKDRLQFKECLEGEFMYRYWCKREYEVSVGDLHEKDLSKYEKIDVYDQLEDNLDVITDYIIREMGITFNKKSKLKERVANVTLTEYDFAKEKNLIIEDLLNIIDHQKEEIKELENREECDIREEYGE